MVRIIVPLAAVLAIVGCDSALAFSKAPPISTVSKTVVRLEPIAQVVIDLPQAMSLSSSGPVTAPTYDFGPNLQGSLAAAMTSDTSHYVLDEQGSGLQAAQSRIANPDPSPTPSPSASAPSEWNGQEVVPAATFTFYVDALVFRSGDHGDSMFYGFDERFRTPFNDGSGALPNEFPLSLINFQPAWFDRTFQDQGTPPFDSQSGLDLGQGFDLNFLVAWISLKYAAYHSEIRMHVQMDAPLVNRHEIKPISVKGSGFFFDVAGGYEEFSGAIGLAHTDAMTAAFKNAFAGSYSVIDNWVKDLPLTALVFDFFPTGEIHLNTGPNSQIAIGTKYVSVDNPTLVFEVTEDVPKSGSIAKLDSGNLSDVKPGMILLEQAASPAPTPSQVSLALARAQVTGPTPVNAESVTLSGTNLPQSDFSGNHFQVTDSWTQDLLDALVEGPLSPYRIWRYYQYDQSYNGVNPDPDPSPTSTDDAQLQPAYAGPDLSASDNPSADIPQDTLDWANQMKSEPWAKQVGLDVAPQMTVDGPIVAVIDGGVDYNHTSLRERIWVNPSPFTDPDGNADTNGWDFISGDPRPYDDGYHGTEVASVVTGIAPLVHIMPLKIFNPFGVTSSAALYGAFKYAVDHGAKMIVAAWSTTPRFYTKTMGVALQYAHDHGVLVVTSAGDLGNNLSNPENESYPASLAKNYDNLLVVTGVDTNDKLVQVNSFFANFDPGTVAIAAPGENILVAQPRSHTSHQTTTSLAAAMVAGAIARNVAASNGAGTYLDWIAAVKAQSQVVPSLVNSVAGGLRLIIK